MFESMPVLRRRTSEKWGRYGTDVLPMYVAEMDVALAPAIRAALTEAVAIGDTGYQYSGDLRAAEAFSSFAEDRWGWAPDPRRMLPTTDVSVVVVESLRRLVRPGEGVVITPPVYSPFGEMVVEAGGRVVEVGLLDDGNSYALDLAGIDRALAADARAVLLCNPHNPVGLAHSREELTELSRIVARHDAVVVSDEIHAALTHPGQVFTPYLTVSDAARDHAIAAVSGSKAFNLAGLKCAMFAASSDRMAALLRRLPQEVSARTGLFGLIATREGFAHSRDWLDALVEAIAGNFTLLADELTRKLPGARVRRAGATYLAWVDFSALGWGDHPADHALRAGKVALSSGPGFGAGGAGYARMNLGCAPETIIEAVDRLAAPRGSSGTLEAPVQVSA